MPPRPCRATGQLVFHVFNRAIQGLMLFEQAGDYAEFLDLAKQACARFRMRVLVYAIMPNHWHLVLWPTHDEGLSAFMHWLTATHAKRWRKAKNSKGRGAVYQGRFKAIAVQWDHHLYRLCLYVERNPLRSRLVDRAEDWSWSSASPLAADESRPQLTAWPVAKPDDWLALVNAVQSRRELEQIRAAIRRGLPFGDTAWRAGTIRRLGWPTGWRRPGRPRSTSQAIDPPSFL